MTVKKPEIWYAFEITLPVRNRKGLVKKHKKETYYFPTDNREIVESLVHLYGRHYVPNSIRRVDPKKSSFSDKFNIWQLWNLSGGEPSKNLRVDVYEFMESMLRSGSKVLEALYIVLKNQKHPVMRLYVIRIIDSVIVGKSVSDGFYKSVNYWGEVTCGVVKVADETGNLQHVFKKIVEEANSSARIKKKIVQSSIYPIGLIIFFYIAVCFFLFSTVPTLEEAYVQYDSKGIELPVMTQALRSASLYVNEGYGWWVLTIIPALLLFAIKFREQVMKSKPVEFILNLIKPIRNYIISYELARMTNMFALILASGTPIARAVNIVSGLVNMPILKVSLKQIEDEINSGNSIGDAFIEVADAFGSDGDKLAAVVDVGERSGNINDMIGAYSKSATEEFEGKASTINAIIEPLSIVFVAIGVGSMVFAMLYPIINAANTI